MKKVLLILFIILIFMLFSACSNNGQTYDIVATTLPVYDFTESLCRGTPLTVGRLVTENVSCLHDYTLQVYQMRMIEAAETVVISGAGLEDFLHDALQKTNSIIDASVNTHIQTGEHSHEEHGHPKHEHTHEVDPHIWLSPENAVIMLINITDGLKEHYPQYSEAFQMNFQSIASKLVELQEYGESALSELSCRDLITFHDGFAYFAESFNLHILEAIEEESGSEASAAEIKHLIEVVMEHNLPAVFIEKSGSDACAGIIHAETGIGIYTLDMAMSGYSYFDAMYHNINTIKEALG